jgi:hypothetical protein
MASNSGGNWVASKVQAAKGLNLSDLKTAAVRIYPTHCTVNGSRKPNNRASTACNMCAQYSIQTRTQFQAGTWPTEPIQTAFGPHTATYQGLSPEEQWPGGDTDH